jgi:NAD(P)-dependent dehydrogenase (short-subunit alcohol dehydrogenase family)
MNGLVNKSVVVTGAAQGVGEAVARQLAREGCSLFLVDCQRERLDLLAVDLGACVAGVACVDLMDVSATGSVIPAAVGAMGCVDGLASVAGQAPRGTVLSTSVDDWDRCVALNLRSHFQLVQATARHLVERGSPGVVALAGSLNAYGGQPDLCAYSAAKGGLVAFAKHAAYALLPHRIRVNIVNFGWIRTPGEVAVQQQVCGRPPGWLDRAGLELPFGKLIEPGEAAEVLVYLLSDRSSVMTGSAVDFEQSVPGAGPTTGLRSAPLSL